MQARSFKTCKLATALALALTGGAALAQSTTGSIYGSVAAGQGDSVTLSSDTGVQRQVAVDSKGRYSSAQIPVGTYKVTLTSHGQPVTTRTGISVIVNSGTEVDFSGVSASSAQTLSGVSVNATAAPQIDVTSTDSRTVITAKELATLPLGRSAEAIAQLAPGVVNNTGGFTSATGQSLVSFGGSSAGENAYYINGFNTTDPLRSEGGITLPYGSIDQEEVYTGGYSAQYGRSDGGVINMVGKRGTDEWHFGTQLLWEPEFARETAPDTYFNDGSGVYNRNSASNYWVTTMDAYVGGPIIKDKLFIFLSAEGQKQQGQVVNSVQDASPYEDYHYSMPKWYAKLDWNITQNNILELTGASNKEETGGNVYYYDYNNKTQEGLKGYMDDIKNGGDLWSAKFTSYITDNLTLTMMYGKMHTVAYDQPSGYDASLPYLADTNFQNPAYTGGTAINNAQTVQSLYSGDRGNKTSNLRVDLNYKLGDHSITIGIDNQNATAIDQGSTDSANGYYWQYAHTNAPTVDLIPAYGVGAPADYPNGAGGYYAIKQTASSLNSVRSAQRAEYIEDKWQINDRWLLSVGLRDDQFTDYDSAGQAYIRETKPQWAPRLGFSWDVFGDSSLKVFGNAGRYYLGLPLQPSIDAASANTSYAQYYTYSGINAQGIPTGLTPFSGEVSANNTFGQAPDPKTVTANNLKAEDQDEFILGFEKTLSPQWTVGSKFMMRILRNAVDDFCDVGTIDNAALAQGFTDTSINSCYLINPGRENTFTVLDQNGAYRQVSLTNAQFGFPQLKRRYYALDNFIEHPFDGKWYAKLSYTFSRSYGDTEGQERSDLRQFGASESEDWDNSYIMDYTNGPQNNDHTHQIKLYGYYKITPEWMVSATASAISGQPKNCIGYYGPNETDPVDYGSSYHWCGGLPSPPGSHGRYPWVTQLDLGLAYSPAFAQHKLSFTFNIFNVMNRQVPTNVDIDYQSAPYSESPTYGIAEYRQLPRYMRLGVTYDY